MACDLCSGRFQVGHPADALLPLRYEPCPACLSLLVDDEMRAEAQAWFGQSMWTAVGPASAAHSPWFGEAVGVDDAWGDMCVLHGHGMVVPLWTGAGQAFALHVLAKRYTERGQPTKWEDLAMALSLDPTLLAPDIPANLPPNLARAAAISTCFAAQTPNPEPES